MPSAASCLRRSPGDGRRAARGSRRSAARTPSLHEWRSRPAERFRSAAGTLGMILSFYAFQELPLADANALSFTRTLWLVPLAAFVVKEQVGWLRISAALPAAGAAVG